MSNGSPSQIDDIGVRPFLQRPHAVVDAQNFGGVARDGLEGDFLGETFTNRQSNAHVEVLLREDGRVGLNGDLALLRRGGYRGFRR